MKNKITFIAIAAASLLSLQIRGADTYTIDPAHRRVGLSARHFGINYVNGVFKEFTGALIMDGDVLKEANATIQA
jgi:polyisoprenoid-binding protein YceI